MGPLKFYAATVSGSVYEIEAQPEITLSPVTVRKVFMPDDTETKISVGATLPDRSSDKFFITKGWGLQFAHISPQHPRSLPNTGYYGAGTNLVVALFTTEQAATYCAQSDDLEEWDERWQDSSEKILNDIGPEHPTVVLTHGIPYGPQVAQR